MLTIPIQSFTIFVNESLLMFDYPEFHNSFGELLRKGNISSAQGTSQSLLRIPGIRTKNKMKTIFMDNDLYFELSYIFGKLCLDNDYEFTW